MKKIESNGNDNNDNNVIMPEEVNNAEVKVVINMADVMQQYQSALKSFTEYGISLGQKIAISGNTQAANNVQQIKAGTSVTQTQDVIGIADKFSYGAYNNQEAFEKALTFYHGPTLETAYFANSGDALAWAHQACCNKNPGKTIPLNPKMNWRNRIINIETEGEDV